MIYGSDPNTVGPGIQGLLAWTEDIAGVAGTGTILIGGTLYLRAIELYAPTLITNIVWWQTANGITPTAGECQAGIYNSAGKLVASSTTAAAGTAMTAGANAVAVCPLSAPVQLAPGMYWIGIVAQAGTLPTLLRNGAGANNTLLNANLAAAAYRVAVNGTLITTGLPASITPGSNVQTNMITMWMGLS